MNKLTLEKELANLSEDEKIAHLLSTVDQLRSKVHEKEAIIVTHEMEKIKYEETIVDLRKAFTKVSRIVKGTTDRFSEATSPEDLRDALITQAVDGGRKYEEV